MERQLVLISHELENTQIHQRAKDGYVNATAMCKAVNKQFNGYFRTVPTQAFLTELSSVTRLSVTELVITIQGGTPELQGTWVHPHVAVNLGQWCSPKFAVAVAQWVQDWMSGKVSPSLPYHLRRYEANRAKVPRLHFSILNEMIIALIAPLEADGYILPDELLPDISEGKMFCAFLRASKGVRTNDLPKYLHDYEDGRTVRANAYPDSLLPDFRRHLHEVWLPKRCIPYFTEKDPKCLPHLARVLPLLLAGPKPLGVKSAFVQMKQAVKDLPLNTPASEESAKSHFQRMRDSLKNPPPPNSTA